LRQTIRPALAAGNIVICDRFIDSTRASQGYAGGCDLGFIDTLERQIVGTDRPQLTLIFDVDAELGLERAGRRKDSTENRFERKGLAFHQRLREGFHKIAAADSGRCRIIVASGSIDETAEAVWGQVSPLVVQ
jgi:dTMP kinase